MNILKTDPVRAFTWQDHDAHIQVHLDAAQDPKMQEIVQNSPKSGQIEAALAAHVIEHLGFKYRREIEKELGVELPPYGEPLPRDVEVRISSLVAEAGSRLLGRDVAEMQLKEQMAKMQDPVVQQQNKQLEIEEAKVQSKMQSDAARIAADLKKASLRAEIEREKMESHEMLKGMEIGAEATLENRKMDIEEGDLEAEKLLKGIKIGNEITKESREDKWLLL